MITLANGQALTPGNAIDLDFGIAMCFVCSVIRLQLGMYCLARLERFQWRRGLMKEVYFVPILIGLVATLMVGYFSLSNQSTLNTPLLIKEERDSRDLAKSAPLLIEVEGSIIDFSNDYAIPKRKIIDIDLDHDGTMDCVWYKVDGVTTIECNNNNFVIEPGQPLPRKKFNPFWFALF